MECTDEPRRREGASPWDCMACLHVHAMGTLSRAMNRRKTGAGQRQTDVHVRWSDTDGTGE